MKSTHLKRFILITLIPIQLFFNSGFLNAQEKKEEGRKGLYYNYVGITIGGGINQIEYNDWFIDKRDTKKISGAYYSGGFIFDIFVRNFVGEFTLQYVYNSNDEDTSVQHVLLTTVGKYTFNLSHAFAVAPGLGLYIETPPSDIEYNGGGGFLATLGAIFNIDKDYKIIFDLIGTYGYFGMGEESTKISYGTKIGIVYNIGRL